MTYITGDIVTLVQKRVRDPNYDPTEIKGYLNDCQNDVFNEYRLPFMEATQAYTLTPSNPDITAGAGYPTDYVLAIDLLNTYPSQEGVVPYRDIREVDLYNPDATDPTAQIPGQLRYWYFYAETIMTNIPDKAYTVLLRYYKKPVLLSSDADIPSIPSQFQELLVVGAAYRVLQVKDNYDQSAILQNKYDEILAKLVVQSSQNQVGQPKQLLSRQYVGRKRF